MGPRDWNEFLNQLPSIIKDNFNSVKAVSVSYPTVHGPSKQSIIVDVYVNGTISTKKLRRLVNNLSEMLQGSVYKGSVTKGVTGRAEEFEGRLEPRVRVNVLDAKHIDGANLEEIGGPEEVLDPDFEPAMD